ncbi:TPA: ATP phosphoribosyltransferase regulatory subunit [Legionella pneumophila]|nr:ATP phosphoribosyltransferase regulatory subunit [Legionella pneumophila]HAT1993809.1 ATP phosphoribosyltransferase regulatory subunit [Legionella pneumophila]HAT2051456.1 ATP phosphoribosyltransferase regulatory subunit [Legionella pneumophila]HAT2060857.1 ATP phosphoribosyltransferase regulatory subunit [Legionella pneumophila]HAT4462888.1 ATP phosphoribosyltransferase regulatory subunit [Legionella pneumophila]
MKSVSQHTEWLSMIEISGSFLALPVLETIFPQGLESLDTYIKRRIRSAYEEWCDAVEENDPQLPDLHRAWVEMVLKEMLEYEDSVLDAALEQFIYNSPDCAGQIKPDFVLRGSDDKNPMLFISIVPPGIDLEKVNVEDGWPVSLLERMSLLCKDKGVTIGLITNGERWMLVNILQNGTSSHVSWYARLWFQEPMTLNAFKSLLSVRRWFGPKEECLPAMIEYSLNYSEDVTDTLGLQVKRAVEVLIQSLDKADQDRNRELLCNVSTTELYEAGLTVMMRLVFILCAEERGLMLLGDSIYDQNYAINTLRGQLTEDAERFGHEILERRYDAWTRILALFRAIYGGIEHESLRMPALGGSLFDPDRFPFLEGRTKGTHWQDALTLPVPINNRTVLLLLEALQIIEQRGGALLLSYKALDVEQIGHVYEGLLEYTIHRLSEDALGFVGSGRAHNPNISLTKLETESINGRDALISLIESVTLRSKSAISNALEKDVDENTFNKIVKITNGDMQLAARLKPFAYLLRMDAWGDCIFYRANSFAVTYGECRLETGTHYTPKSLTESIVRTTLEPLVYMGPAEGELRENWRIKSSLELLKLKICDPAMGSGAFLVQVCRWISERLVEAWGIEEAQGKFITVDGVAKEAAGIDELMPISLDERLLIARRLVAEKCLYGVDLNPLAVELAKLSIWLITLAKGRPFGFLDHNLRSGDSLLGLLKLEQLVAFSWNPEAEKINTICSANFEETIQNAIALRKQLRETSIRDIRDIEYMEELDRRARQELEYIKIIADAMTGKVLTSGDNPQALNKSMANLATFAKAYIEGDQEIGTQIETSARTSLSTELHKNNLPRKPFHWCLEFPEVFERGGFDGIVGNPPFMGGQKITGVFGKCYRDYLVERIAKGKRGSADFVAYFFIRANDLLCSKGAFGLIAVNTISEGNTREVGLDTIIASGSTIYNATPNVIWPGKANVVTSSVHVTKDVWHGMKYIAGNQVEIISSALTQRINWQPVKLKQNQGVVFQGVIILGDGFIVDEDSLAKWKRENDHSEEVVFDYLIGKEVNQSPTHNPSRKVINFFDWDENKAKTYLNAFNHVIKNVKPRRLEANDTGAKEFWWRFLRPRSELFHLIGRGHRFEKHPSDWDETQKPLERVIVFATGATKYPCFTLVPNTYIFANTLCVIASQSYALFACLSSDIHAIWAWEYCSKMKQDMRYTHGDIFETFPFPTGVLEDHHRELATLGEIFFHTRAKFMQHQNKGMTKFYNDFHDPGQNSNTVGELRKMQIDMNYAVLKAYGFENINLNHDFHEVGYLPKGKNIRFTISENARDQLLSRLAILNKTYHEREVE